MQAQYLSWIIALLIPLSWNLASSAHAEQRSSRAIDTASIQRSLPIGSLVDYYEDKSSQQTPEEIQMLVEEEWLPSQVEVPSFGFVDSRFWIRFTLSPHKTRSNWYLEVAHPLHDVLTLYESGPAGLRKVASIGDRMPFKQRMIKTTNIVFEITLEPDRETTFWLSSKSESSMAFPLTIWDKDEFQNELIKEYVIKGFYYGMIAVMGLYNFLLFLTSRQTEYLKYVLYIWSSTCFQMALSGIAFQYLWPESTWMANEGIALLAGVLCFFIVWFTQSFLNTRYYARRIHMALNALMILGFGLMIFAFLGPHKLAIQFGNYLSLLTASTMLYVCISSIYLKIPQARFFVLAFVAFFCGVVLVVLKISGIVPTNFFTAYGFQVGSALEVVLLSIAVGDKIRIEHLQAGQKIQDAHSEIRKLNETLQILNRDLEKNVHEKTIDLQRRNSQIETILNSLPMGVVTVDQGLCIVQHSKWLTRFFENDALGGQSIIELLLSKSNLQADDQDIIAKAVSLLIGEDEVSFLLNEVHLPREIYFRAADAERIIELSWNIIVDERGVIDKVLITIHDVTDMRDARREAEQKSRHLTMVGEILGLSVDRFGHFVDSTLQLLNEIDVILTQQLASSDWNDILRILHTLKGNSRTYGLSFLNNLVHQVESALTVRSISEVISQGPSQQASAMCQQIRVLILEYQTISQKTLNRSNDLAKDKLILRFNQWLNELQKDSRWRDLPDRENIREIVLELDKFCNLTLEDLLSPMLSSLGSLAIQLHKHVPYVKIINDQRVTINKGMMHWFESVFTHLFRNSLDHGFTEDQRGTIIIAVHAAGDALQLVYHDDGKGLNLGKLAAKYASRSEIGSWSPDQLAYLIFNDSVSSKDDVSDISGRGIGMSAVKKMIEDVHGNIRIELGEADQDQFTPFVLVIELPWAPGILGQYQATG